MTTIGKCRQNIAQIGRDPAVRRWQNTIEDEDAVRCSFSHPPMPRLAVAASSGDIFLPPQGKIEQIPRLSAPLGIHHPHHFGAVKEIGLVTEVT